ncbi:MAG: PolC-type DNA polymerase III, partial [Clostridia bacterium]|nr:PolC-type DNA polymerase III [Clostridia bacterium]
MDKSLLNIVGMNSNIEIQKVLVNIKDKTWKLYIRSDELIDYNQVYALKKRIKEKYSFLDSFEIKIRYNIKFDSLEHLFKVYWNNIKFYTEEKLPSFKCWSKKCYYKIKDNCVYIILPDQSSLQMLNIKKLKQSMQNLIDEQFGIKAAIKLISNNFIAANSEEYIKAKNAEDANLVAFALNQNQQKKSKPKTTRKNRLTKDDTIPISDIDSNSGTVSCQGKIIRLDLKQLKSGRFLAIFDITDFESSITIKYFMKKKNTDVLSKGAWVKVKGDCQYDKYERDLVITAYEIIKIQPEVRTDDCEEKRVELHAHTQLSAMDGVTPVKNLINKAAQMGHPAIAVTDHGVVQAYPEAFDAGKKCGIKILYGVEAYVVNDRENIVINADNTQLQDEFIIFDLETTGLKPSEDRIIEIGAVKVKNGEIVDEFSSMIDPGISIPAKITELTGIDDKMVKNAPKIEEILPNFLKFISDNPIVAHNASFDTAFIKKSCDMMGIAIKNPVIDTLALSRVLYPKLKTYKLNKVAEHLNIKLDNHHRAVDDAKATALIFLKCLKKLKNRGIKDISQINECFADEVNYAKVPSYHAVILVKNQEGLKNLYKLISLSHLKYYYRRPRIPKSIFNKYREGLIISTGCESGELYRALLNRWDMQKIEEIANFYDYFEIQPLGNNEFLIRDGKVKDVQELKKLNKKIVQLGDKFNKPVVATGDVHFVNKNDECFRRILMWGQGFEDANKQAPLYLRTTSEMLEEFSYLGEKTARKVVIDNTLKINQMIEDIEPIPDKLYPPIIEGADKEIKEMAICNAKKLYGDDLPETVKRRLDKELNSIISNGFAVLYLIAHKLVKKSLDDGYLVGSRGSVGSSFVATMCNITEVNPLPPHYSCPKCKYSDFDIDLNKYPCGIDLPDKHCPICGTGLKKDGHNIPFEVFLGFKGDKVPDIDLNFSGEYQPVAHKYTEELFGEGHVFRAGTIGTIATKTAFGFVKNYCEDNGLVIHNAEMNRLIDGCTGVKRTTGQHPGGIMVVPKNMDIHQFTPIQHPADDKRSSIITTHFDYHSISSRLVKLDILGHDDPTVIKMLEDLTGVDATKISLDDEQTMSIFSSTKALNIDEEDINSEVGTFGIPEFGTKFVRQMLVDTKPKTFAELVRISGLSHGTDVWLNNAQILIKNKTATLKEVICTRDDIMTYLIQKGMEPTLAFKIMEKVRKGKGIDQNEEKKMRQVEVPEWFIDSCKKIKYMFPKAHAVAYVTMAFRIAYFKVHYPEAFYATYFTVRADDFDADLISSGKQAVKNKIEELESANSKLTQKEKNLLTISEVALEMYQRGINMLKVDLYRSDAKKFLITEKGILPPINSLQGVGNNAAENIIKARAKGKFISIEDIVTRSRVSKTVIEVLKNHGCLKGLPESNQLSLFG